MFWLTFSTAQYISKHKKIYEGISVEFPEELVKTFPTLLFKLPEEYFKEYQEKT